MSRQIVEVDLFGEVKEIEFGATGIRDIVQCLRTIAKTRIGTVPLDRALGTSWDWVDKPEPVAMARFREDLLDAIEKFEPRVEQPEITFRKSTNAAMAGRLSPFVRVVVKEGVEL